MSDSLKYVEEVEQFNGTKVAHNFNFTNRLSTADTGVSSPAATVKPTGTGLDISGIASMGLVVQVTVDATGVTDEYMNQEFLIEVTATGATSGFKPILKKRIKLVAKIQ